MAGTVGFRVQQARWTPCGWHIPTWPFIRPWGGQPPGLCWRPPPPRPQEIDGKALLLLRSDVMMKYMGLKLGPALKLSYHIERLKQGKF